MLTDLVQDPVPETTTPERSENVDADADAPPIVREEKQLLTVVLRKLDAGAPRKSRIQVDDASALIELRDALAEAKPEDQGSILEQMHRIEALSRQRGKGDTPPVDRKSPYFGHLRLEENGKRRDVLIGAAQLRRAGRRRADRRLAERARLAPLLPLRRRATPTRSAWAIGWSRARCWRAARSPSSTASCAGSRRRRGRSRAICAPGSLARGRGPAGAAADRARRSAARWSPAPRGVGAAPPRGRRRRAATRGKLGLDENGARRPDRHLPGDRRAHRSAPVRADHPALLGPHRRAGLGRQRQDHHRPAPHRLPGVRRSAPLPPREDAGDRLPAGAGRLRVAGAAVAGRRRACR